MCQHSGEIRHGQTEGRRTRGEVYHGGNISYTVHASRIILTNPSLLFILVIESRIVIFLKNQEYIL